MKPLNYLFALMLILPTVSFAQDTKSLDELSADVKSITSITTVYSQIIQHNLPKGWVPVFENATPGHYILEFTPKGESKENWSQMFTIQGFRGLGQKASPKAMLAFTADLHVKACGDQAVFELLGTEKISGFETQSAIIGCASGGIKKEMGEIAYYKAVKGTNEFYIFHKAMRTKAFNPKSPPLTKKNGKGFFADFMPIALLDKKK